MSKFNSKSYYCCDWSINIREPYEDDIDSLSYDVDVEFYDCIEEFVWFEYTGIKNIYCTLSSKSFTRILKSNICLLCSIFRSFNPLLNKINNILT